MTSFVLYRAQKHKNLKKKFSNKAEDISLKNQTQHYSESSYLKTLNVLLYRRFRLARSAPPFKDATDLAPQY